MIKPYTVTQISNYLKSILDFDKNLHNVLVQGELVNYKRHFPSNHAYFSIKDEKSQLGCMMYSSNVDKLKFTPEDGMKVICKGEFSYYPPVGRLQFYVYEIIPDGLGEQERALEILTGKLSREGLFDKKYKKDIPLYPRKLGVATSSSGAVIKDIKNVCARRFPLCEIVLAPTLVQGDGAPEQLVKAVERLDSIPDVDVIIIGRGGGSKEDLSAFNTEAVARAVFNCKTPIISAVGHGINRTLCDETADISASTPSEAAELAVPDKLDLLAYISSAQNIIEKSIRSKIDFEYQRLDQITYKSVFSDPHMFIEQKRDVLDVMYDDLNNCYKAFVDSRKNDFIKAVSMLDAYSPLATLARGYSLAQHKGRIVKSAKDVSVGDSITITLSDGSIDCCVEEVKNEQ